MTLQLFSQHVFIFMSGQFEATAATLAAEVEGSAPASSHEEAVEEVAPGSSTDVPMEADPYLNIFTSIRYFVYIDNTGT